MILEKVKKFREIFIVTGVVVLLTALQWQVWITNDLIFTHDSIIWYGAFSYFADCIYKGFLPLWNPYMNCGEPFFLNINILHLLDPSTLFLLLIGKFFNLGICRIFHYDLLLRYIIFIIGSYFFFKHVTKRRISAIIAFVTITFSSLATSYLRQHAFILAFYLLPWILLAICNFFELKKPKILIWIAFLLGTILCSYHAMFMMSFLTILLACLFISKGLLKVDVKVFTRDTKFVLLSAIIFLLLVIHLWPAYLKFNRDVIATVKIFEAPSGAYSFPADFFNLLTPCWFVLHFFNCHYMSESFLYIGLVPLFFALIGLTFSRHKYKIGFLLTTIVTILLMLGNRSPVYAAFRKFFPFFSVIRNTHTFGPAFIFCLTYFTGIGVDVIMDYADILKTAIYKMRFIFFVFLFCALALLINYSLFDKYPLLVGRSHMLYGYRVTVPSIEYFEGIFNIALHQSNLHLILFFVGIVVIAALLSAKRPNISTAVTHFVITSLIFADLLLFNMTAYWFVTMPKYRISLPYSVLSQKMVYRDFRIPVIEPEYPLYGFAPAMLKVFTAYSTKTPWVTTHFFETKNFFEFINNKRILNNVKDTLMGISASKLRFMKRAKVLPHDTIAEVLETIDSDTLYDTVLIEENLPFRYAYLEGPADRSDKEVSKEADIKIKSFSPNEILIDIHNNSDGFLYYSDGFDEDWRVFVNGKERKVYKTDLAFKSVIVDKGYNSVHFLYDPKLYKLGLACYFLGILCFIAVISFFNI